MAFSEERCATSRLRSRLFVWPFYFYAALKMLYKTNNKDRKNVLGKITFSSANLCWKKWKYSFLFKNDFTASILTKTRKIPVNNISIHQKE